MKMKTIAMALATVALLAGGCFKNQSKPADVPTVIGLEALAKTNRAEVVRLFLRGTKTPIPADALKALPKLEVLDLAECNLKELPADVCALATLQDLYLARNPLDKLPPELAQLGHLRYLNLDGARLAAVPDVVAKLPSLKWLRLSENQLTDLPPALAALKDLRRLYVRRNKLAAVPEVVKEWPLVEDLAFDQNSIEDVPQWLTALPKLRNVSFAGCRVKKLPDDLSGWKRLSTLVLSGCPIPETEMKRIRAALPDVAMLF